MARLMDGLTDRRMDQEMDGQSDMIFYRDALSHLKIFYFQALHLLDLSRAETMNCVNHQQAEPEISQETLQHVRKLEIVTKQFLTRMIWDCE